jgi:hypothetical protein
VFEEKYTLSFLLTSAGEIRRGFYFAKKEGKK